MFSSDNEKYLDILRKALIPYLMHVSNMNEHYKSQSISIWDGEFSLAFIILIRIQSHGRKIEKPLLSEIICPSPHDKLVLKVQSENSVIKGLSFQLFDEGDTNSLSPNMLSHFNEQRVLSLSLLKWLMVLLLPHYQCQDTFGVAPTAKPTPFSLTDDQKVKSDCSEIPVNKIPTVFL